MPEVLFTVQLPDGETKECYSPSSVIRRHFKAGEEMPMDEFLARSRAGLHEASERVRARYGVACSAAAGQLAEIERWAGNYPNSHTVRILTI